MLGGAFCCIRRRPTFVSKLLGLPTSLCILNDVCYTFGFTIHFPLAFVLSILFCIMLLCDGLCADRLSMILEIEQPDVTLKKPPVRRGWLLIYNGFETTGQDQPLIFDPGHF
ncbi:hypothetical protein NC651_021881 [Populus alba x Populus x berolinensis]|nr:hypothetical protein NC651_021881 [Populus alba x Populus x berolinensis]